VQHRAGRRACGWPAAVRSLLRARAAQASISRQRSAEIGRQRSSRSAAPHRDPSLRAAGCCSVDISVQRLL
jgi:hypothetical protein